MSIKEKQLKNNIEITFLQGALDSEFSLNDQKLMLANQVTPFVIAELKKLEALRVPFLEITFDLLEVKNPKVMVKAVDGTLYVMYPLEEKVEKMPKITIELL